MPTSSKPGSADPTRPGSSPNAGRRRTIYGRRQGRPLKQGRENALAEWLPRLSVAVPAQGLGAVPAAGSAQSTLDPATLFETPVDEVWLEVGFGSGEHLLAQAAHHPRVGIIGCEPFINGMAALLLAIAREPARTANIRVLMDDARSLIAVLPDASLAKVFVLFPDPWPKARHAKRRFISPENLDALARVMKPGAELRVASDDEGYISWTLEHVPGHPAFMPLRTASEWRQRPAEGWPVTRYEAKARAQGRNPAFFAFRRR